MDSLNPLSEVLHVHGVTAIQVIQQNLSSQERNLILLSKIFDPRYAFTIFCPLLYSLNNTYGLVLIWSIAMTEWVNQILKLFLMSDRPYWWIKETDVFNRTGIQVPVIKQFPLTCETGPGSPSGHAMATASVWFIVLYSFFLWFKEKRFPGRRILQIIAWSAYVAALYGVSVSRLYIAAHFPHQCLLGIGLGVMIAKGVKELPVDRFRLGTYIAVTIVMFGSVAAIYAGMPFLGVDPSRTVNKAVKYCINKNWVHLDTTPLYSIMRYVGYFLGTGIALSIRKQVKSSGLNRLLILVLSFFACKFSESVRIPSDNLRLFYAASFGLNVLIPVAFIAVIPMLVTAVFPPDQGHRKKK